MLFTQLAFHIFKIHAPYACFIPHQRAMYDLIAIVAQTAREADISRRMQQYLFAAGAADIERTDHAAQHAIFIADAFLRDCLLYTSSLSTFSSFAAAKSAIVGSSCKNRR